MLKPNPPPKTPFFSESRWVCLLSLLLPLPISKVFGLPESKRKLSPVTLDSLFRCLELHEINHILQNKLSVITPRVQQIDKGQEAGVFRVTCIPSPRATVDLKPQVFSFTDSCVPLLVSTTLKHKWKKSTRFLLLCIPTPQGHSKSKKLLDPKSQVFGGDTKQKQQTNTCQAEFTTVPNNRHNFSFFNAFPTWPTS